MELLLNEVMKWERSAVLIEISEEWETGKTYLTIETSSPAL